MNHVALEQPFFMRSCQTYWRNPPKARSVTVHSFAGRRSETMLNAPRKTLESVIKASRGFRSDLTANEGAGFNSWRGENWAQEKAINFDYLKSSGTPLVSRFFFLSSFFLFFFWQRSRGQCRWALSEWRIQEHWVQLDWIMGLLDWLQDNHRAKVAAVP